jgi:2-succinyl-6-hydroxy-2,4-cyclohexadiene-1-carboxylate synthase
VAGSGARRTIVLLHGFSGTRRAWDGVLACLPVERCEGLALDLPGHGSLAGAGPITFAGAVAQVLAAAPTRFELGGYSLGGRVALLVALAAPARVDRLVLVSTGAGLEHDAERARRRAADREIADALEREPLELFIERWRSQPLFAGEPPRASELARADQRRNRPTELAAALRGLGAGEMEPLWARLHELAMPVEIVVGERDEKYREIGRRMASSIADARLTELEGGHGLPLENPAALARVIEQVQAGSATSPAGSDAVSRSP